MPVPPKLVRRLVIAPLVALVELALIGATPLLAVLAAIASPLTGGAWRPLRALAIAIGWAVHHLAAMLACLGLWIVGGLGLRADSARMRRRYDTVLRLYVDGVDRLVTRCARVAVQVRDSEAAEAVLSANRRPAIVLGRHAGEGDTLLVLHAIMCRYGRRPRVVLHEDLRLDPVIDVLGGRLQYRFVDPRGGDTEAEIAELARGLDDDCALLIFPEGGNFSAARRSRSIAHLDKAGFEEEAARAREMTHVLAPRPGGTLAALDAAPNADVVVLGHVGIPEGLGELWRVLLAPRSVDVRLWVESGAAVPAGREERIDWLFGWWRTLDRWVDEREPSQPPRDDGHRPAAPEGPEQRLE